MLEPLVVKATRAVPRRERRSNPPDLSNECEAVMPQSYLTFLYIIYFTASCLITRNT